MTAEAWSAATAALAVRRRASPAGWFAQAGSHAPRTWPNRRPYLTFADARRSPCCGPAGSGCARPRRVGRDASTVSRAAGPSAA